MGLGIDGVALVYDLIGDEDSWQRTSGRVRLSCHRIDQFSPLFEISANSRDDLDTLLTIRLTHRGDLLTAFATNTSDGSDELIYAHTDAGDVGDRSEGERVALELFRRLDRFRAPTLER